MQARLYCRPQQQQSRQHLAPMSNEAACRKQGCTCARGPIQQDTFGGLDTKALEAFLVGDRQHYRLHQLLDLLI